ncbi:hypothetical protein M1M40_gp11 [Halorubrum tailed virus 29]|uniref:Uncharacterized protein n=1 Tax=Halorubrum tailed virus 29 TaxID=2878010 RepID=A0AAE9BYU6_9CAUD|nr:hypothetical protein M1M40_gp11 [Halorubrum tailed virus 29]UBF23289.1 hypothetical protein HRTV-29_gp11 [Halorubrum tailed virus 29]
MTEQETLTTQSVNTDTLRGTVYTVTVRWMDSPHPECIGVFQDESDANELMKRCRDKWSEPKGVVAWEKNTVKIK